MQLNRLTLAEAAEGFNLTLRVENKSPQTITTYAEALGRLMQFTGDNITMSDLTTNRLREWVLSLQNHITAKGKPLSPHTVSIYVRGVKAFLSWCEREGLVAEKPALKTPKVPKKQPETLSDTDIRALLTSAKRVSTRAYALVSFLLDTGCRATELCNMRVADVDLEGGTALIREGKGGKDRVVQFGGQTAQALWTYLKVRRYQSSFLFCNQQGSKLTYNALRLIICRLGKRIDINELHPHIFRHTFATVYLAAGGSVVFCQKLMGHESILTTMGYVHMAELRADRQRISVVGEAMKDN